MSASKNSTGVLLRLLIRQPFWMAFSILLSSLAILFGVGLIGTSAYLISYAALLPSIAVLQVSIVGVRFFGLARSIFRYLERLASHSVNFNMLTRLRGLLFRQYADQFPSSYLKIGSGEVLSSLIEDVETIEFYFIRVVNPPLTALVTGLITSLLLLGFHSRLVSLFLLFFFGSVLLALIAATLLARLSARGYIQKRSNLHTKLAEYVNGLPDLIVNQTESSWLTQLTKIEHEFQQSEVKIALSTGLANGLILILSHGSMLAMLIAAGTLVEQGVLEGKLLAACALLTLASFDAIQPLSLAAQQSALIQQAANRVILPDQANPIPTPTNQLIIPQNTPRQISCTNLSFQMDKTQPFALQDIDLTWSAGQWIALVGPSGAGKTTLAKLLLDYWNDFSGHITFDHHSLETLSPEWVRSQVAYSGQSAYFMNASLRENLSIAKPNISDEQMMTTLEVCQLDEWYQALPEGLDTPLGERGLKLSDGERRRLDMARMILRDTPFLIFDEPLAGLDSLTETRLVQSLRSRLKHQGVLWITHRITGLAEMDQILVLDQGKIIQQGKMADLVDSTGMFKQMLSIQNRIIE